MSRINDQKQAKWQKIISDWKLSGLNATKWCKANQIKYSRFQYWRHRLSDLAFPDSESKFIELSLNQKSPPNKNPIEVSVGFVKITLAVDFDEETFKRLIRILERSV